MLFRKIESLIEDHLQSDSKKILLIDGARQVGKTYIIRHVGHKLFENFIEINMVEDSIGPRLFAETKTVEDFYLQVSMLEGSKMKQKDNTLIFIDEIQAYAKTYPCIFRRKHIIVGVKECQNEKTAATIQNGTHRANTARRKTG